MNRPQHNSMHPDAAIVVHLIVIIGLSACTSVDRQIFSHDYVNHPVLPENVQLLTETNVKSGCQKVALLTAKGEQPEEKMLAKLRKAAGQLGANTLLVVKSRRTTMQDVVEALPEAAAAGALGIDAKPPPARIVETIAYYCAEAD